MRSQYPGKCVEFLELDRRDVGTGGEREEGGWEEGEVSDVSYFYGGWLGSNDVCVVR